jgi:hypothetical protein
MKGTAMRNGGELVVEQRQKSIERCPIAAMPG